MPLPDSGFKKIIDEIAASRKQTQPVQTSQSTPLLAIDARGNVMPFERWMKRWVNENIDGRRRIH